MAFEKFSRIFLQLELSMSDALSQSPVRPYERLGQRLIQLAVIC